MIKIGDAFERFNSDRVELAPALDTNVTPRDELEATMKELAAIIEKDRAGWSRTWCITGRRVTTPQHSEWSSKETTPLLGNHGRICLKD